MAGELAVTIVEAKGLDDDDFFSGSSDAYAEVYVDEHYKQRTATIPNSKNPQWNETLFIRLDHHHHHLHIKVFDDDGTLGRDTIGSAKIDLKPVKESGSFEDWVKLPRLFGLGSHGQVYIRMTFQA